MWKSRSRKQSHGKGWTPKHVAFPVAVKSRQLLGRRLFFFT